MYVTTLQEIENPFLYDATLVCQAKGYRLISLHMDSSGECGITFDGIIPVRKIAELLQNYIPQDTLLSNIHPQEHKDYVYYKDECYTQIYTPDGIDYRKL